MRFIVMAKIRKKRNLGNLQRHFLPQMLSPMFTTFCTILPLLPIGISLIANLITSVKRVTSSNIITYQLTGLHMIMNICQSPTLF